MKQKLERNIKLDYCFTVLNNFNLSGAIWVLYLAFCGMSLTQIGILEGIFHVTSMLSEIPSGALADLLGRKKTILAGRICLAFSCLILLAAGHTVGFWGFVPGFILQAWGYNLNSGSEEALLYDSMKQCGREGDYMQVNSRINVLIEIAQSVSTVAGGILAEYSYTFCYLAAVFVAVLSLLPASLMEEPVLENRRGETKGVLKTLSEHFKTCGHIIKTEKQIRSVLLSFSSIAAVYATLFFYSQQYFFDLGLNKIQISMIMLGAGGASCLGSLLSRIIYGKIEGKTVYAGAAVIAGSMAVFGFRSLLPSIAVFLLASFANAMLYPVQSICLNRLIPSEQRATLISVDSMLFSVVMIVLFPAAGAVAENLGLAAAFALEGLLCLAVIGRVWTSGSRSL